MAKRIAKPTLQPGDRIAVVSPASYANPDLVTAGCARLREYGYDPVIMPHALSRGPLYYAGTAQQRADDLHAAFADPSVRGVFCTRGGWGSAEILPLLDRDIVCSNPKAFIGYSDHTSLHAWFWNECCLPTFYAPMVAADWSRPDGVDERSWNCAMQRNEQLQWRLGSADGLRVLRAGTAHGALLGGCLSILAEALGTAWALRVETPSVLFLEDIGTKPYKWDRLLQHLRFAGLLKNAAGIIFGDMSANIDANESDLMDKACLHALQGFDGPIAAGLKCGHVERDNRSLVLGAEVILACDAEATVTFEAEQ